MTGEEAASAYAQQVVAATRELQKSLLLAGMPMAQAALALQGALMSAATETATGPAIAEAIQALGDIARHENALALRVARGLPSM